MASVKRHCVQFLGDAYTTVTSAFARENVVMKQQTGSEENLNALNDLSLESRDASDEVEENLNFNNAQTIDAPKFTIDFNIPDEPSYTTLPPSPPSSSDVEESDLEQQRTKSKLNLRKPFSKHFTRENVLGNSAGTKLQISTKRRNLRAEERKIKEEKARLEAERKRQEAALLKRRLGRIEPPKDVRLFEDLSTEEQTVAHQAIYLSRGTAKVATAVDGNDIHGHDFQKLQSRTWLNDEIVNASVSLSVSQVREHFSDARGKTPTVHSFPSAFYTSLQQGATKGRTVKNVHGKVAKWATRKKLGGEKFLECNLIVTPINLGNSHWTLLAISPKYKTVEYYDSLGGWSQDVIDLTKMFLEGELGDLYSEDEWEFRAGESPQQSNGSDCGVFVCTTAKMLLLGYEPMVTFDSKVMEEQRKRIAIELINNKIKGAPATGWLQENVP